jgi:hypothetical protein
MGKELHTKQRNVCEFLLLRWGNRVNLHVVVYQRLDDECFEEIILGRSSFSPMRKLKLIALISPVSRSDCWFAKQ